MVTTFLIMVAENEENTLVGEKTKEKNCDGKEDEKEGA